MSTKKTTSRTDYIFIAQIFVLLVFGLIMLTSASSPVGQARFDDGYWFIKRQILFGVIPGVVLFLLFARIPYQVWQKRMWLVYFLTIGALILVFIPGLGSTLNAGAQSWIVIGGVSMQPAEFAKLGIPIFIAAYATLLGNRIEQAADGFLPLLMYSLIPVGLVVLQPDIGTVSILFAIIFGMLYIAKARISHLVALAASGVAALVLMIAVAPYRAARFTTFLHPELDPQGVGYHINQAILAVGSGGLFGLGLGNSKQKFQYLPEVHADSIFAVIAEEVGFFLAAGVVLLITMIAIRGFRIAKNAKDPFGRLLVSGVIIWFFFAIIFKHWRNTRAITTYGCSTPICKPWGDSTYDCTRRSWYGGKCQ